MIPKYLAAILTFLGALMLPGIAHADECGYFWCESYLTYDSGNNLVYGYSLTEDWYYTGDYVGVEAYFYDPNSWEIYGAWQEGYESAEADFSTTPSSTGYYSIEAEHYWDDYLWEYYMWVWEDLGPSYASAYVSLSQQGPPSVTSVSLDTGEQVRGAIVTWQVDGTNLTNCSASPQATVYIDGTWGSYLYNCSPSEFDIGYSIPENMSTGSHTLTVTTSYGSSSGSFTVDDPTPSIQSLSSYVWDPGTVWSFTITGTGFGSSPLIAITGDVGSYGITSASDTAISAWVDTSSLGGSAAVTVTANGYGGNGFMQGWPGEAETSGPAEATISAPGCGDQRDTIIAQYAKYGVHLTPTCSSFAQSAQSEYYTSLMTGNSWAIIRQPLTINKSNGYGLDRWVQLYGTARGLTSVYRTPLDNAAAQGKPQSRHMYGDAADLDNPSRLLTDWQNLISAANGANADFVEPQSGRCGLSCAHADWRNH